ncbi:probable pectinesterase 67 [Impatiens glandulifera]|uniref:probable pectinesterase 67 n=1 Tax=Impatiens glandulifera TaxID=253017 RepID=UPI001FB10172|nr:probable pectinesterase 67 [Impatiens glandulifera]
MMMFQQTRSLSSKFLVVLCVFTLDTLLVSTAPISVIDFPLLRQKIKSKHDITVDINGGGEFTSVQKAVDSIPAGNTEWYTINVKKGVYKETVHIPTNKPYIFMRGNGKGRTHIVSSQSSSNNFQSATFIVEAPNFVAFGMSFKNNAPTGLAFTSQNQSVAVIAAGDKAAFYHCGFFSNHNTLFDYKGRHYYDSCYIQGSIDFIFGRGQSIYHDCELFVIIDRRVEVLGSITAQSRENADGTSGFIFDGGKVYGIGEVYLGRPKGAYSRVLFANTYISRTITPQGWTTWRYEGPTENLFQAEYKCHGPGANISSRAAWSKQLTDAEANLLTSIDFINGKDWLPAWL